MKYLYTTEPDEGCHEINGVYGRPVHTNEQAKLKSLGWKESPDGLRHEEEVRQEAQEQVIRDEDLVKAYHAVFGKKPHHKMKPETIRERLDEAYNDNDPV